MALSGKGNARTSRNTVLVQRAKRECTQVIISVRTSEEKVSSISLYSDTAPVRQCWNRWFRPASALMTLTEEFSGTDTEEDRETELVSAVGAVADRKFEPEPEPRSELESAAGTDSE